MNYFNPKAVLVVLEVAGILLLSTQSAFAISEFERGYNAGLKACNAGVGTPNGGVVCTLRWVSLDGDPMPAATGKGFNRKEAMKALMRDCTLFGGASGRRTNAEKCVEEAPSASCIPIIR